MPTLNVSTNVPLDGVSTSDILKDLSKAVARTIGKPEQVSASFRHQNSRVFFFLQDRRKRMQKPFLVSFASAKTCMEVLSKFSSRNSM
jgi:hypothetical protein